MNTIKQIYRHGRRAASTVKRRLISGQSSPTITVPFTKPVIRQEAIEHNGRPFRAAVIGAGNQGRDICMGLGQLEGVEIAAVADRSGEALSRLQTEVNLAGTRFYQDAKALLEAESIDLACIATNTPSHVPLGCMALEAGVKYLLLEKPIGTNPQAARNLVAACEAKGVPLAVDHGRRWSLDYQAMKRYINSGRLGSVRQIYVTFGSGGLAMNGVHFIDLMRFFADSEFVWVIGHLDQVIDPNKRGAEYYDPSGYALFGFVNGARGFLDLSHDLLRKDSFIVIKTEHGRIEVDERARQWTVVGQDTRFTVPFADSKSLAGKVARVAAELLSGDKPKSDGHDGVAALEAVIGAHLSHEQQRQAVSLPLTAEQQATDIRFP